MAAEKLKTYCTIGCCGIDCGLCPRFHTEGEAVCPGCGGDNFKEKHPSCGFLTCCAIKKELEVCGDCDAYPCNRFDREKEGFDSFVTHKRVFVNNDLIKGLGIDLFIAQQQRRMEILQIFVSTFDDGRSKSFFCITCALLPLEILERTIEIAGNLNHTMETKQKNKFVKNYLQEIASQLNIELKLNKQR